MFKIVWNALALYGGYKLYKKVRKSKTMIEIKIGKQYGDLVKWNKTIVIN